MSSQIQAQLQFKYLTINDGLTNNRINTICQDSLGFIWIGTPYGANKYDGYQVTQYHHCFEDSTTLLSSRINVIFADSHNNLWFGTDAGLNLYNPDLDCFEVFHHQDLKNPAGSVNTITEDKNSNLWIGTSDGAYVYNLEKKIFHYYGYDPDHQQGLSGNPHIVFTVDKYPVNIISG